MTLRYLPYLALLVTFFVGLWVEEVNGQFTGCDFSRSVTAGEVLYVETPRFPYYYNANTNCRWRFSTVLGRKLNVNCYDVVLPYSSQCSADRIEVSPSGNSALVGARRFCGQSTFVVQSTANSLVLALRSQRTSSGGRFRCQISSVLPPCDCGRRKTVKIVNGVPTLVNEFPMMAGLVGLTAKMVFCGATIISNRHAVTAAHCLQGKRISDTGLLVGDHDLRSGTETRFSTLMTQEIVFNAGVGPACLPWKWPSATFNNYLVEAAGWGTVDFGAPVSSVLMKVTLGVISYEQCRTMMATGNAVLSQSQICTFAASRDTCQFDSGGPILYTNPTNGVVYHVGIISYGVACASGSPSVNTRTTAYLNWIKQNTAGISYCEK
ncbi:venom serine protease-like isoform X2 [Uranotaenia lowii]|uniref:venom serine protease-like isoform X2 n=1 Tax=Uranotaenia lowii TaxID=190385 RepID=UPI002479AA13|nr:venom serine protease-like isoform X2 [Uranotaenia lowii]